MAKASRRACRVCTMIAGLVLSLMFRSLGSTKWSIVRTSGDHSR